MLVEVLHYGGGNVGSLLRALERCEIPYTVLKGTIDGSFPSGKHPVILPGVGAFGAIMQGLKLYRLDNQRYPTTGQGLQALITIPTSSPIPANWKSGGYLDRLSKDPWGNAYQYQAPGSRGEIDVFSMGADGQAGGAGIDADIGSWMD